MPTQDLTAEVLLRQFPMLLKHSIQLAARELRDGLPPKLRSEGAFIRAAIASPYGWPIILAALGLPYEAARIARLHHASLASAWIAASNVATVIVSLVSACALIAYSLEFQRARPQTVLWQRVAIRLTELARLENNCADDSILYAADLTLRHLKHRRTYGVSAISASLTAITLWLGKDWLEKAVNHVAPSYSEVTLVAVMLAFIGGYSIFHFPVWTLEGIRDALHRQLEIHAAAHHPLHTTARDRRRRTVRRFRIGAARTEITPAQTVPTRAAAYPISRRPKRAHERRR
jgi:hypothetical protein